MIHLIHQIRPIRILLSYDCAMLWVEEHEAENIVRDILEFGLKWELPSKIKKDTILKSYYEEYAPDMFNPDIAFEYIPLRLINRVTLYAPLYEEKAEEFKKSHGQALKISKETVL